jgi:eukaryotic translation initiation factor 2C
MKLGGINHVLMSGSGPLNWLTSKRTMLIGCDVTHPSPGSLEGTPSIAAVVASNDNNFAQYPASLRLQESRKEVSGRPNTALLHCWKSDILPLDDNAPR